MVFEIRYTGCTYRNVEAKHVEECGVSPRPTMESSKHNRPQTKRVTLKAVAEHLGLTPGTVSAVWNNSAASRSIPEHTRKRILDAIRSMKYRPNFMARSLRVNRTFTIGVILEEIGDAYGSSIVSGIEEYTREQNYFFLTVVHRHDAQLLDTYSQMLLARGVEGILTVDTSIREVPALPTVAVAGHRTLDNVTNIVIDHHKAARLALTHLQELGHREIAFLKGQPESSDSEDRWSGIQEVARELGIAINPNLVVQMTGADSTPELGHSFGHQLLSRKVSFTALFAYNDIAAIGAMRALQEVGLSVPEDVSVVGFDDVASATFCIPPLTTVRQPLKKMGRIAAETLLDRIEERGEFKHEIPVEPELVVRQSSAPAGKKSQAAK